MVIQREASWFLGDSLSVQSLYAPLVQALLTVQKHAHQVYLSLIVSVCEWWFVSTCVPCGWLVETHKTPVTLPFFPNHSSLCLFKY